MKQVFDSKKGASLLIVGLFVLLATLGIIIAVNTVEDVPVIGEKQYAVMIANEKASAVDLFIDNILLRAVNKMNEEFYENDGVFKEETEQGSVSSYKCGEYMFPRYYVAGSNQNCIPDYKEEFKSFVSSSSFNQLKDYPDYSININPSINYVTQSDVFDCDGDETIAETHRRQAQQPAWKNEEKTYIEIASEVASETGVDMPLLLAHATIESSMGKENSCTDSGKSSLTGCGWPSSCASGCKCEDTRGYFVSDKAQFECTARVDINAFLAKGTYQRCEDHLDDKRKLFDCVMCTYQGSYYTAHGEGNTKSFSEDGTCEYAELMQDLYCGWKNELEDDDLAKTSNNGLFMTLEAQEPIIIPIGDVDTTDFEVSPENYPNGILGTYGNEIIIPCSSSSCLADIAEYYHSIYPSYNYVWGGESPYTYKDTLDLTTQKDSIFHNMESQISKTEPGKNEFTRPGFDCSGWVWWVGRHANSTLFNARQGANAYYNMFFDSDSTKEVCAKNTDTPCTIENIVNEAKPGDLLFYKSPDDLVVSHIMIYVGDGKISHARGSKGLVKEPLPASYEGNIIAVYHLTEKAFTGEYNSLKDYINQEKDSDKSDQSEDENIPATSCSLTIDFSQINKDAIKNERLGYKKIQQVIDKHNLDETIREAGEKYNVPSAYIKAIITAEVGGLSFLDKYLSGEEKVSESGMRGPMQLSRSACDTLKQNDIICNYDDIKKGDVKHAIMASTANIALLRDRTKYIDKDNPDYYFLSLAYNAGQGSLANVLEEASERTGIEEQELLWRDISFEDVKQGIKRVGTGWAQKESKWNEVYEYPNLVATSLSQQCTGTLYKKGMVGGEDSNTISIQPKSRIPIDMPFERLSYIKHFINDIDDCDDELKDCVSDQLNKFNYGREGASLSELFGLTIYSSEFTEKKYAGVYTSKMFAYEFIEELMDCSTNKQTECVCAIDINMSKLKQNTVDIVLEWNSPIASQADLIVNGNYEKTISLPPLSVKTKREYINAEDKLHLTLHKDLDRVDIDAGMQSWTFDIHNISLMKHFSYEDYYQNEQLYDIPLFQRSMGDLTTSISQNDMAFHDDFITYYFNPENFRPEYPDISSIPQESKKCKTDLVDYAKKYLGTGYGSDGICSAEDAQAGKCTTQCGSYITNIFREVFSDPVYGNGNQKCDIHSDVKNNQFLNPELLKPGDLFSSDGLSEAAKKYGHTGMYVGKGIVSDTVRTTSSGKPYCHRSFTQDEHGEHVFIHSVGPVCYSTFDELISPDGQARNMISFCRYEKCKGEQTEISSVKARSGMTLMEYDETRMEPFTCRESKDSFVFFASPKDVNQNIGFSVKLKDTTPPDNVESVSASQSMCGGVPTAIFTWKDNQDDIYAYNITVKKINSKDSTTFIVPISHTVKHPNSDSTSFLGNLNILNKPYVTEKQHGSETERKYTFHAGSTGEKKLFNTSGTYEYEIKPLDHHLNSPPRGRKDAFEIFISEKGLEKISSSIVGSDMVGDISQKALKILLEKTCTNYYSILQRDHDAIFYDLGESSMLDKEVDHAVEE
ncbi:MAG: NlpC/P60 family protein [Nanoarchaeota archaeon]